MSWFVEVEQFIPFVKPLFDGLRSARDFLRRDVGGRTARSVTIPKKTLILLPGVHSNALIWSVGKAGNRDGMQISGHLQATNTSEFHIRAAGIKLLRPKGIEVLMQMVTVKDPQTGMHSYEHFIVARSIGEVSFMFFAVPCKGVMGKPLKATISVQDQFGNEHVSRNHSFKYVGPIP